MRMSRARLCQNKNNNNTSFVNERLGEAREAMRGKATRAKSTGKMTVNPPASSRVLTERRAIPLPIQGLISNPHGSDQNGELHEERIYCVCGCMQEDGDYVIVDEKLCPEKEKKATKQVLLILILILVLVPILVRRRGINSCILHSQKCVRCEMFEKRQQQQLQGPYRLQ